MNFHGYIALPLESQAREIGIDTSADSIECGQFVEVMFQILDFKGVTYENFKEKCLPYKGKAVSEFPKDKAFELYEDFKSFLSNDSVDIKTENIGKTKKSKLKKIVIAVLLLVFLGIITVLVFLPNFIKNKTFNNGIQGTYYCSDVMVKHKAEELGYSESRLNDLLIGQEIKIDEYGVLSGLILLEDDYDSHLKFDSSYYFDLSDNYIRYLPKTPYEEQGFLTLPDFGIVEVYFSKQGSQIAADTYASEDMIELYIAANDVNAESAFILRFEKK